MEAKKSYRACLSRERTTGYLLGLILVLSSLFVALEWNSGGQQDTWTDEDADAIEEDLEAAPPDQRSDKETTAPAVQRAVTANLRPSDAVAEIPQTISANSSNALEGLGQFRPETEDPQPISLPQATLKPDDTDDKPDVGQLPQFPGGMTAFIQWLNRNLKYPVTAQQQKKQGQVTVTFIINTDGSTADIKVSKSSGIPALDFEAVRVLRTMPRWTPGKEKGKPCRTMVAVPVVFKL